MVAAAEGGWTGVVLVEEFARTAKLDFPTPLF